MENNKLIERVPTEKDARLKQIILTDISRQRVNEMDKCFETLNSELEKGLSEKEKEQFLLTLRKMKNNIKHKV